jgi:hypothetical protein
MLIVCYNTNIRKLLGVKMTTEQYDDLAQDIRNRIEELEDRLLDCIEDETEYEEVQEAIYNLEQNLKKVVKNLKY